MDSEQVNGKLGTGSGDSPDLSDSDILVYTGHINREGFERVVSECPSKRRKKVLGCSRRYSRRSILPVSGGTPAHCRSRGSTLLESASTLPQIRLSDG